MKEYQDYESIPGYMSQLPVLPLEYDFEYEQQLIEQITEGDASLTTE